MIGIIFRQVVIMFLLSGIGFVLYKTGKLSNEGSKNIGNILIYLSLPCVIINGFMVEFSKERLVGLGISAVVSFATLVLSMVLSRVIGGKHALDNFAGSFSNPGFFGVPIIVASLSSGAVFYLASYIAFVNLLQWTYGVSLLKRSDESGMLVKASNTEKESLGSAVTGILKRLIKAPFMVGIIIGLFMFFTQLPMPELIGKCINYIANLNTPLAMFTIGIYAAQADLKRLFMKPRLYKITAARLVIIPLITLALVHFLPISNMELKMSILIACACPVGSNIAVYAQLHGRDYCYAVETVVMSTLFSIVTLPLFVGIANML